MTAGAGGASDAPDRFLSDWWAGDGCYGNYWAVTNPPLDGGEDCEVEGWHARRGPVVTTVEFSSGFPSERQ